MLLPIARCSASSTLGGDEEVYGAGNVADGREDTCWNSDGGAQQALVLTLAARAASVAALELVFQGGFVGQDMRVAGRADACSSSECGSGGSGDAAAAACACVCAGATEAELGRFQPQDANEPQRFALARAGPVRELRVSFTGSTDFYGRVVVYAARVYGSSSEGGAEAVCGGEQPEGGGGGTG